MTDDVIYRCWQRTGIIPEEYGIEDVPIEIEENNETAAYQKIVVKPKLVVFEEE